MSRKQSRARLWALAALSTGLLASMAACGSADSDAAVSAANATQNFINWGKCPAVTPGSTRNPLEKCGTVTVPLNYQQPGGKTISIEVSEIATAKPGKKRGYLLLNPGGPALEGLDMPSHDGPGAARLGPRRVRPDRVRPARRRAQHPDELRPVEPATPPPSPTPPPTARSPRTSPAPKSVAQACAKIGDELQYFTTANTARDMDRIRMALGVPKISYWGQSYGTYLGAVYASLFPQQHRPHGPGRQRRPQRRSGSRRSSCGTRA